MSDNPVTTEGSVLNHRYQIDRVLNDKGGMGMIYQATDLNLRGTVVLKKSRFVDEQSRSAFEREARLLYGLRHNALPRVIDYFLTNDGGQFFVMEFIPGKDLSELLTGRIEQGEGPFPVNQVLDWGEQLLDALHYLHMHEPPIIHRDIKPQNLKLMPNGQIILLDFGLAKGSVSGMTMGVSIQGYTPNYAPLEQMRGSGTDERSDIYSLAVTLHCLLSGQMPPDAVSRAIETLSAQPDPLSPVHEINPHIPLIISEVLAKGSSLNQNERPQTALEMLELLRSARAAYLRGEAKEVTAKVANGLASQATPANAPPPAPTQPSAPHPEENKQLIENLSANAGNLVTDSNPDKQALKVAPYATPAPKPGSNEQALTAEPPREPAQQVEGFPVKTDAVGVVKPNVQPVPPPVQAAANSFIAQPPLAPAIAPPLNPPQKAVQPPIAPPFEVDSEKLRPADLVIIEHTVEGQAATTQVKRPNGQAPVPERRSANQAPGLPRPEPPAPPPFTPNLADHPARAQADILNKQFNQATLRRAMERANELDGPRPLPQNQVKKEPPKVEPEKQFNKVAPSLDSPSVNVSASLYPGMRSYTEVVGYGVRIEMHAIPGGDFLMGSAEKRGYADEYPQHRVTVSPFYIGKFPVTQKQYRAIMRTNPSKHLDDAQPVESVTWDEAVDFCRRLTVNTGRIYRLPTEAEWEYACRAGMNTQYNFGDEEDFLNQHGWNITNAGNHARPVGEKKPNGWGLGDMHGNVWEWCLDWYAPDFYRTSPNVNPTGPVRGTSRVLRGGSWYSLPNYCRNATRSNHQPDQRDPMVGFRLVCEAR